MQKAEWAAAQHLLSPFSSPSMVWHFVMAVGLGKISSKAKCYHLKNWPACKGTLGQLFIDWRYSQSQLCELLPLSPSLWFNSPPFPVCILYKYTLYTYTVRNKGGRGYGVLGLRQISTSCIVPLQVHFLDDDISHCLLWVLSFCAVITPDCFLCSNFWLFSADWQTIIV